MVTAGARLVVMVFLPCARRMAFSKTGVYSPVSPPSPISTQRTVLLTFSITSGWLHLQEAGWCDKEFTYLHLSLIFCMKMPLPNCWNALCQQLPPHLAMYHTSSWAEGWTPHAVEGIWSQRHWIPVSSSGISQMSSALPYYGNVLNEGTAVLSVEDLRAHQT